MGLNKTERTARAANRELVSNAFHVLFSACKTNRSQEALEKLCLAEGWLWRCKCGENNPCDRDACGDQTCDGTIKTKVGGW